MLLENLGEELLHRFPRTVVGIWVVGGAFGIIPARVPIRKAMHRAAVRDQLPVHAGLAHFALKRRDFLRGHERIIRAVQSEDFAFDLLRVIGVGRGQPAVKTDNAGQFRAAAGEFERRGAAETIADGGDSAACRCARVASRPPVPPHAGA